MDQSRLRTLYDLEEKLAYRFREINLLSTALTHLPMSMKISYRIFPIMKDLNFG